MATMSKFLYKANPGINGQEPNDSITIQKRCKLRVYKTNRFKIGKENYRIGKDRTLLNSLSQVKLQSDTSGTTSNISEVAIESVKHILHNTLSKTFAKELSLYTNALKGLMWTSVVINIIRILLDIYSMYRNGCDRYNVAALVLSISQLIITIISIIGVELITIGNITELVSNNIFTFLPELGGKFPNISEFLNKFSDEPILPIATTVEDLEESQLTEEHDHKRPIARAMYSRFKEYDSGIELDWKNVSDGFKYQIIGLNCVECRNSLMRLRAYTDKQVKDFPKGQMNIQPFERYFEQTQYKPQMEAPSVNTVITGILGLVGIGITLSSMSGDANSIALGKNIVQGSALKKALRENTSDAKEFVEVFAEEVFGYQISPMSALLTVIRNSISELDTLRGKPLVHFTSDPAEFFKFRSVIKEAQDISTQGNKTASKKDGNISNAYLLLNQAIIAAKSTFAEIQKTLLSTTPRIETKLTHIVGKPGHGKTYFVNAYLLPEVATRMGWDKSVYQLSFGGQKEYWPPYQGQRMAMFDEFLALKEEDALIDHLNLLGSTTAMNMPGADLQHKVQPCLLQFVALISNMPYCNLKRKLHSDVEEAFYSRLTPRFEIINTKVSPNMNRNQIPHSKNYSELEIRKFEVAADVNSSLNNDAEEYVVVTKEEMVISICDALEEKRMQFETMMLAEEEEVELQSDGVEHLNYLIAGPPGTGKSHIASAVGTELSKLFHRPLIQLTVENLEKVKLPNEPCVIVLHDKLTDERAYCHFYDTLRFPSIVINTCNLSFSRCYTYGASGSAQCDIPSVSENLLTRGVNVMCNWYNRFMTKSWCLKDYGSQRNQEPGFIRRLGLPGSCYHLNQTSFRRHEFSGYIVSSTGFKMQCGITNDYKTQEAITEEIYEKYMKITKETGQLVFKHIDKVEDMVEAEWDLILKMENVKQLVDTVNDISKVITAWNNGGTEIIPSITASQRLINSSFTFTPRMFHIENYQSTEDIINMASSSYATLRTGSIDFTCKIEAGEFQARCVNNSIEFVINSKEMVKIYDWKVVGGDIIVNECKNNEVIFCRKYKAEGVIRGLQNGFQYSDDIVNFHHTKLFVQSKQLILKHPELQHLVRKTKMIKLSADSVDAKHVAWKATWEQFRSSRMYLVLCILAVVMVSVTAIYSLILLTRRLVGNNAKLTGLPFKILINDEVVKIIAHMEKEEIFVEATTCSSDISKEDIEEHLKILIEEEHGEKYTLGSLKLIVQESSDYTKDIKHTNKNRGKAKPSAPSRLIKNNVITKETIQGVSNLQLPDKVIIREKIYNAQCWVQCDGGKCYGLRISGDYILSVAHIVKDSYLASANIALQIKGQTVVKEDVPCQVIFCDYINDVSILKILDKTIPHAPNIKQFFFKKKNSSNISSAALMLKACTGSRRTVSWFKAPSEVMEGYVTWRRTPIDNMGGKPVIKSAYEFERWQADGISTKEGDCGSVYIATHSGCGEAIILGMHTGCYPHGKMTLASCISREYLDDILTSASKGRDATIRGKSTLQSECVTICADYQEIAGIEHPKFKPETTILLDDFVSDWYKNLEDGNRYYYDNDNESIDDIWYDAEENPDSNLYLVGYDPKAKKSAVQKPSHVQAPWSTEIDNQPLTKNAVFSLNEVKDKSKLLLMSGKPSIMGTQLSGYNDYVHWDDELQELLDHSDRLLNARYKSLYKAKYRLLTGMEVINGTYINPRDEFARELESIDFDSSVGWYGQMKHKRMVKEPYFQEWTEGPYERTLYWWSDDKDSQEMYMRCRDTEDLARRGLRLMTPVKDNLKAELLPIKKVEIGKTRCFQCMDISEVLLFRKYTGALQAIFKKRHEEGYCKIGIDPYVGFNALYHRLRQTSSFGEAGDFKRWDKHLLAVLIKAAMNINLNLYLDGSKDMNEQSLIELKNVWKVMTDMIIYTCCIADGYVYWKMRGNPSGNVITAMLNSQINDLLTIMSIVYLAKQHNTTLDLGRLPVFKTELAEVWSPSIIKEHINVTSEWIFTNFDWCNYGDDVLMTIKPNYLWLVNFKSRQAFFNEKLRIEYDTPDKDGSDYYYKELSQLQFLSRTLSFDEKTGLCTPYLKEDTLNSWLHWLRNNTKEQYTDNIRNLLTEAILYDEQTYDTYKEFAEEIIQWLHRYKRMNIQIYPEEYQDFRLVTERIIRNGRRGLDPQY